MARIVRVYERKARWWEGQEVYCDRCGCSFTLEAADEIVRFSFGDDNRFQVVCANCAKPVVFMKPDWS